MTDFDYDCYKKKQIGYSAIKRKCGSKSRKCSLPSDRLTTKQWNERCGNVMSYQIGKPMQWLEFQKLPKDLKEEYLNNLIEKYSANAKNMAEMFGVNPATIFRVVKNDGLNVRFLRGKHPTGDQLQAYQRFLDGEEYESDNVCLGVPEEEHEDVQQQDSRDDGPRTQLDSFTMNFSGKVNVDMIANSLKYILASSQNAKIQIICELENG